MKKGIIGALLLLLAVQMWGIPARRTTFKVRQSDGTELSLMLCGDEFYHFTATTDGVPVVQATDGNYYYGIWSDTGLMPSDGLAHNAESRKADETAYIDGLRSDVYDGISARWTQRRARRTAHRAVGSPLRAPLQGTQSPRSYKGQKKGLIILVNYTDVKFQSSHNNAMYTAMANNENYKGNNQYGSVRDYFYSQSYGQFELLFDVVGPVQLSHNMAYYGGNVNDGDSHPGEMAAEACMLANSQVNFADYDWDGDGEVDQVFVLYAGYGEAYPGADPNTIWPHEWNLYDSDYGKRLYLDGVYINTYACSNELQGISGTTSCGIGTICHEFSHCLGLMDLYDTSYSGNFGMFTWSLMDYGSYLDDGNCPAPYTSYERWLCGWLDPVELDSPQKISGMKPITDTPEAYIIYNDAYPDEYYLLENHQLKGWGSKAYGHGLLVLHVDYDASVWNKNTINNTSSRQRLTVIPADNKLDETSESVTGDPFPGSKSKTALTDATTPAATLYNLNTDGRRYMGKPIENITETSDGTISFDFMGGVYVPAPVALPATDVHADGFTARWEPVGEADSYTLRLYAYQEGADAAPKTLITEDCSGFVSSSLGSTNISSSLDKYTSTPGWTGSYLYRSSYGIKMGTSSYNGHLATPLMNGSGKVTVQLQAWTFSSKSTLTLNVRLLNAAGTVLETKNCTVQTEAMQLYEVEFDNVSGDFSIDIAPQSRMYLNGVVVTCGQDVTQTTLTGLTATSHAFADLSGRFFAYQVQAVSGTSVSAWSDLISVDLLTGIGRVEALPLRSDADVEVYAPDGTLLRRAPFGTWQRGLSRGVYILRQDKNTCKIVIR